MTPLHDVFGGLVLVGVFAALLTLLGSVAGWVVVQLKNRLQLPATLALALAVVSVPTALLTAAYCIGRFFRPLLWGMP